MEDWMAVYWMLKSTRGLNHGSCQSLGGCFRDSPLETPRGISHDANTMASNFRIPFGQFCCILGPWTHPVSFWQWRLPCPREWHGGTLPRKRWRRGGLSNRKLLAWTQTMRNPRFAAGSSVYICPASSPVNPRQVANVNEGYTIDHFMGQKSIWREIKLTLMIRSYEILTSLNGLSWLILYTYIYIHHIYRMNKQSSYQFSWIYWNPQWLPSSKLTVCYGKWPFTSLIFP